MPAPLDVLVRGAGPVGCAAALALRDAGLRVGILGGGAAAAFRPIALSHASRLILERLGAWKGLEASAIMAVEVSQSGGFGRTRFDAGDAGVPALGYVVDYGRLARSLQAGIEDLLVNGELAARCTVHAEGATEEAIEKRYAQDALVALVHAEPPAQAIAFERFTAEGPLALLPFGGRHAVVWSLRPQRARELAAAPDAQFLRAFSAAAGRRAGRALKVEARALQPLALRVRRARVGARAVYIGNAAQTLHPVAGQGLNLGLRDAWELGQALRGAADPGDAATLERYAASRRLDAQATVRITDLLARGFTGSSRLASAVRGAALTALDVLPGPRRFFARRMIFGPFALP